MDPETGILRDDASIQALLRSSRRIAVLGIKPETEASQPAHYVAAYLARAGLDVVPVPVYYPEVREILGRAVYRTLNEIPGPIDIVDVFRRPSDIPAHLPDILEKKPRAVWFQSGIRNDEAAMILAASGIQVVQDLCLMIEHRRLA